MGTTTAAKKGDVVSAAATADAPVVKGPTIIDGQVAHSTTELALEVFRDLGDFASGELTGLLKPVESSWQPQDYLPDPESDSFLDEVRELRERSQCLPDDYLDDRRRHDHGGGASDVHGDAERARWRE